MRNSSKLIEKLANKYIAVIGAGLSGIWASILLSRHCRGVLLSDAKEVAIGDKELQILKSENVKIELGKHSDDILRSQLVVVSPGVSPESEIIRKIRARKIEILSEVEIAYWFAKNARIIGITGSNGKSTTTYLTYQLLKNSKNKVFYGGNIGIPFSKLILEARPIDRSTIFILELSSFQLENTKYFRPYISAILNITPDHLDRYHSFESYIGAKLNIYKNQREEDYFVYNYDDPILKERVPRHCKAIPFSIDTEIPTPVSYKNNSVYSQKGIKIADVKDYPLPGKHNLYNLLASLTIATLMDTSEELLAKRIPKLKGLEHRVEFVACIKGIKFYNDSKATNVESVKYAVRGFDAPVILILGGKDKGADFYELRECIKNRVKKSIIMGDCKKKIEEAFRGYIEYELATTMEDAVRKAFSSAEKGDIILLSPACASFDMYKNFEERGKDFKKWVRKLQDEHEAS